MRHACDPRPNQSARIPATVSMLLAVWLCGAAASAAELFFPNPVYSVGERPAAVAVGDLDSDGAMDLVVGTGAGINARVGLSILLGTGDGRFGPATAFEVGTGPSAVTIGEFNGDARPDVVVADSGSNRVLFLVGTGDGRIGPPRAHAAGLSPAALLADDFNADGQPDLAVANFDSDDVSILLGGIGGDFAPQMRFAAGFRPRALAGGDLNADGRWDLVVANTWFPGTTAQLTILPGLGDGQFAPGYPVDGGRFPQAIATGDFDDDGRLDIAAVNELDETVSVLMGHGDGTFESRAVLATVEDPEHLSVGDMDGDGRPDLVIGGASSSRLSVHLGVGDGTFAPEKRFNVGTVRALALGRFDADDRLDVATAGRASDVAILMGLGGGDLGPIHRSSVGREPLDIVVDGSFHSGFRVPVPESVLAIASADLNGDRRPDLVATHGSDTISVLLNLPGGGFQAAVPYDVGWGYPVSVEAHDLGGDGRLDLFVVNEIANVLSVLEGRGDGTFDAGVRYSTGGEEPSSIAFGDFNGDGSEDVAVANLYSQDVSIFTALHDTLELQGRYFASCAPTAVTSGEFTGDHFDDLVLTSPCSAELAILPGRAALLNRPPVASAGPDIEVSCVSGSLRLDASGSVDPDSTPGSNDDIASYRWLASVEAGGELVLATEAVVEAELSCAKRRPAASPRSGPSLPAGRHEITLEVTDTTGLVSRDTLTVTVVRPGESRGR